MWSTRLLAFGFMRGDTSGLWIIRLGTFRKIARSVHSRVDEHSVDNMIGSSRALPSERFLQACGRPAMLEGCPQCESRLQRVGDQ